MVNCDSLQQLFFKHEVGPKLVAQRCCGISIFGDAQESMGHGPEQSGLIRSALSWGGQGVDGGQQTR